MIYSSSRGGLRPLSAWNSANSPLLKKGRTTQKYESKKNQEKTQLLQYGLTKGFSGFGQAESESGLYFVRVNSLVS